MLYVIQIAYCETHPDGQMDGQMDGQIDGQMD